MAKGEKTKLLWADPTYRLHMSEAHKGQIPTNLEKLRIANLGNKYTLGRTPWIKGKHHSLETRKKISEAQLRLTKHNIPPILVGKNNPLWKGDDVSYRSLHKWVERHRGKATTCSFCNKEGTGRQIQWANISHQYKRDLEDFISLCVKCHRGYDRKVRV